MRMALSSRVVTIWMLLAAPFYSHRGSGNMSFASADNRDADTCSRTLPFEEEFYTFEMSSLNVAGQADRLTVLLTWGTEQPTEALKKGGWKRAGFTSQGIANTWNKFTFFGHVFHRQGHYVLVPGSHGDVVEQACLFRSLVQNCKQVNVVVLPDKLGGKAMMQRTELILAWLVKFLSPLTVALLLAEGQNAQEYRNELRTILDKYDEAAGIQDWKVSRKNIPKELMSFQFARDVSSQLPLKLPEQLMLDEKVGVFNDIFDKLNCLFRSLSVVALEQVKAYVKHHDYDFVALAHLANVARYLTQQLENAVSLSQMIFIIKQSDMFAFITDVCQLLQTLYRFIKYSHFMEAAFDTKVDWELPELRSNFDQLKTYTQEIVNWKNYSIQITSLLTDNRNYDLQAEFLGSKNPEQLRSKFCDSYNQCTKEPYSSFMLDQAKQIKKMVQTTRTCAHGVLRIQGSTISTKAIQDIAQSFTSCKFHTVFVMALVELVVDSSITLPSKNLLIFSPVWKVQEANLRVDLSGKEVSTRSEETLLDPPGNNGGNFLGYFANFSGDPFTVVSNGGKGGKGRNSPVELRDSSMVDEVNGECQLVDDAVAEKWLMHGATQGGKGGKEGKADIINLGEEMNPSSVIMKEGNPGEHGEPGIAKETQLYCNPKLMVIHRGELISQEANFSTLPRPLDEPVSRQAGKSMFQQIVSHLDRNLSSSLMSMNRQLENLASTAAVNLTEAIDHYLDFNDAFSDPDDRVHDLFFPYYFEQFNRFLENVKMDELPAEDKIRINYFYALLIIRNSRKMYYKSNFVRETDKYLQIIRESFAELKNPKTPWSIERMRLFNKERYQSYIDDVDNYSNDIIVHTLDELYFKIDKLFTKSMIDFEQAIEKNADPISFDKIKMELQICMNLIFLAKRGTFAVKLPMDEWQEFGFPQALIEGFHQEGISTVSIFQKYLSLRPRPYSYFLVSSPTNKTSAQLQITPEICFIISLQQREANEQIYLEMTALYTFVDLLRQYSEEFEESELYCPECAETFDNTQNLIRTSNDECFSRTSEFDPKQLTHIDPMFHKHQKIDTSINKSRVVDTCIEDISNFKYFFCDPETYGDRYVSAFRNIEDKQNLLYQGFLTDDTNPETPEGKKMKLLMNLVHPSNQILSFIEIAYEYVNNGTLLERLLNLAVHLNNKNADFNTFIRAYKGVKRSYHTVLREDILRTMNATSPEVTRMNKLYFSWLNLFYQFKRWTGSMTHLEAPFDFFNMSGMKLELLLSLLMRMFTELKTAKEDEDMAAYLANINANKPHEEEIQDEQVKKQVTRLSDTLRVDLMTRGYEQARAAFQQAAYPFARAYYLVLNLPEMDAIRNVSIIVRDFDQRLEALFQIKEEMKTNIMDQDQYIITAGFYTTKCVLCRPFYAWSLDDIRQQGSDIQDFYDGKPIHLFADIRTTLKRLDALKGKDFNVQLAPRVQRDDIHYRRDLELINEPLSQCAVRLTHSGLSYSMYGSRMFTLSSRNITFERALPATTEKIDDEAFIMSPFTMWTFQLLDCRGKLERIKHMVGRLELVGQGQFVSNYLEDLKMDLYYQQESYSVDFTGAFFTLQ